MPYIIKPYKTGYKVAKRDEPNITFSKKPLTLKKAKKQLKAIGINEHIKGGNKNDLFFEQLKKINFNPEDYLKYAKFVAKNRNYDPKLLKFANDGIHKLKYNDIPFGRINYNDKIIYSFLECNNKIPEGTTKIKYTNYRKRAYNVMKKTNNKYSKSSLAYNILW